MSHQSFVPKVVSLAAEARSRSAADMWRLRADQSLLPRLGKSALGTVLKSEFIRSRVLATIAGSYGDNEVISNGSEQIVMKDGPDKVVKLLVGSLDLGPGALSVASRVMQQRSDTAEEYLDENWLHTDFEIDELKNGKPIIIARQPLITDANFHWSAANVPTSGESRRLGEGMAALRNQTGLYPDILGINNIAEHGDTGRLQIVDTIVGHETDLNFVPLGRDTTVKQITDEQIDRWLS